MAKKKRGPMPPPPAPPIATSYYASEEETRKYELKIQEIMERENVDRETAEAILITE